MARPGHLARQGGRKVRPPGVLDDRVLNPRQKNMNQDGKVLEPNYGLDFFIFPSSDFLYRIIRITTNLEFQNRNSVSNSSSSLL